jgi:hypothetical protein
MKSPDGLLDQGKNIDKPYMFRPADKKKTENNKYPEQVRNDHDGLAGKPVGNYPGGRTEKCSWDVFGNEEPADCPTGSSEFREEHKNADIIEPVSQLAGDTGQPESPVWAVGSEKYLIRLETSDCQYRLFLFIRL